MPRRESKMRLVRQLASCAIALSITMMSVYGDSSRVTFQEEASQDRPAESSLPPVFEQNDFKNRGVSNRSRQGKDLFDWIGLGTGKDVDPYLAETNKACLNGDLAECFKSRALNSFSDFFDQVEYSLNDNVKVVRMSRDIVKEVSRQPYEFATSPRSDDSEWDKMVKFAIRKAERFVKTFKFEVDIPSWAVGENEVYAPRFIDEIADEIDTLENKKDSLFSRHKLRKLVIPMLIVLKLFKLKLLLFLPLILGLASFKKFLGFLAIVIPGLIGFFRLCKPFTQSYQPPVYTQSGLGYPVYKEGPSHGFTDHASYQPTSYHEGHHGDTVSFGQDLAYQGYREYRS